VLALSLVGLRRRPDDPQAERPVGAAAAAASGLVAPAVWFFVLAGDGVPSLETVAVLGGVTLAVLYLIGPTPGHGFHLATLAVSAWVLALALAVGGIGGDALFGGAAETLADSVTSAGVASIVLGLALLAVGWWLDRCRLAGAATPLLGVGTVATVAGLVLALRDAVPLLAAPVVLLGAAAVVAAGRPGCRRGQLWAGEVLAGAAGVVATDGLVAGRGVVTRAVVVAALGAVLVAAAALVERRPGRGDVAAGWASSSSDLG
ncbi:MAG: hypothetical protein ACRDZW_00915, partial [Acidimicrobiales bacterium]